MESKPVPYIRWMASDWFAGKISSRPAVEQALFINLQALIMHNGGSIEIDAERRLDLSDRLHVETEAVDKAITNMTRRGIIVATEDGRFTIKFLQRQFDSIRLTANRRSEAGRIGGKANASTYQANASDSQAIASVDRAKAKQTEAKPSPLTQSNEKRVREKRVKICNNAKGRDTLRDRWNDLAGAHNLPKIRRITDKMLKHYICRMRTEPKFWALLTEELPQLGEFVHQGRWFNFLWIVKSDDNMEKLFNGQYRRGSELTGMAIEKPANVPDAVHENLLKASGGNHDVYHQRLSAWRAASK